MAEPDMVAPPTRRVPAWLLDTALAAAGAALPLVVAAAGGPATERRALTWPDAFIAAVAFVLIFFRRRWPLPILGVSAALTVWSIAVTGRPEGFIVTTVVVSYTVAVQTDRVTAWRAGALTAAAVYGASVAWSDRVWFGPPLGVVAWIGMATAAGDATRSRRAYIAAIEERARRAEQTREEETRRRVVEERVRIARDLHDVVAHHIAVVNVHAGLAEHTVRTRPEQAEASLVHVRRAAQTVLDELAMILAVLRQPGDSDAPTEPTRGLSQLGELLDSVAAAGLRVKHRQVGVARDLPAAIDHTAYRIVQETLTNAHKHGTGNVADLCIEYRSDAVVIDTGNPTGVTSNRPDSTGHGLIGMRERATAVGGSLVAGTDATGRFHVRAVLPSTAQPEGTS
ncbi:sensor histidine kinase [Actinoplanes campanulatus]|uniref:sensor histidine kinase n=1 Tax=Actinoplanes campanulatus TaxID=113559 RepID=UPI0019531244|nr:histidine kinase [Actinoplanes capillaceus]